MWLSSKDLPLRVESRKLAPRFVSPFPISKVVNLAAVQLNLPRSLRVHPTFHVAQIKPVKESALVPASRPPPTPRFIDGSLVFKVKRLLVVCQWGRGHQYLVDWQGYGAGSRPATLGTPLPFGTSATAIMTSPGHQVPSLEEGVLL